jgi:hypothetical protein
MSQKYNIYCDESCHLENDRQGSMFLGAVWCPYDKVKEVSERIREFKLKHSLKKDFETKWTKVSPGKVDFYLDIVDYFFDEDDLRFRCLIVPDKNILEHEKFNQDHDAFYYKMYFDMLKIIFNPESNYDIYIDIKDTQGIEKIRKLQEVLCNNMYDFDRKIINKIQQVRSHEAEILQLADLLMGAVSYNARDLSASRAKTSLVERIKKRSGYELNRTTLLKEEKFNLFFWRNNEQ